MGCNSSAPASEPGSRTTAKGTKKGQGVFPGTIEWEYFGMEGRGAPLKQMFTYHGQANNKKCWDFAGWGAAKAAGNVGEFGGLPMATVVVNGKSHRLGQFAAVMRMFAIKYGYYNTKDFKASMYCDPIVETWADFANACGGVMFAQPADQADCVAKVVGVCDKLNKLMESNLAHHGGKFAAGNSIGLADFVMVAYIGAAYPSSGEPDALQQAIMAGAPMPPQFKVYAMALTKECPYTKDPA